MSRPSQAVRAVRLEAPRAQSARIAPAHSLRRVGRWVTTLFADGGTSARFSAERGRDEGLLRRVEGRRRY